MHLGRNTGWTAWPKVKLQLSLTPRVTQARPLFSPPELKRRVGHPGPDTFRVSEAKSPL